MIKRIINTCLLLTLVTFCASKFNFSQASYENESFYKVLTKEDIKLYSKIFNLQKKTIKNRHSENGKK